MLTFAFDVYGTLINTSGVTETLERHVGGKAAHFALRWREKQLEYSFRRGLMKQYGGFPQCIRNALDYVCLELDENLSDETRHELMQSYRILPAYDDAIAGLQRLRDREARMFAFSNGMPADVESLLRHAGILEFFEGIISVDSIRSFKPDPVVYEYFLEQTHTQPDQGWLVSSNPFDVIGAVNTGMNAAWIKRSPQMLFDPWEIQPTRIMSTLTDLPELVDQ